ncbi:MAG: nitroreductase family protein [Bacteroidales bacterium]|nr:nitroreductase family protein [Bacteroidales bacterium]
MRILKYQNTMMKTELGNLLTRRTIREYSDRKIEQKDLESILESGMRASNCGNMQLYSIVVTRKQENKEALCKLHFNQPMVKNADVVLTVCADVNRFHKYCELRGAKPAYNNFLWFQVSTIDAVICSQAMVTAAETLGIGACYLGTVTYMAKPIAELLNLPKHVIPVTTITLGYPAVMPELTERLPLSAVVHDERYENYTEERLEELYADFERLPQIQNYIKESGQENLAKVFTEVRYPEKDSVVFSKAYMEFAKEQDMM